MILFVVSRAPTIVADGLEESNLKGTIVQKFVELSIEIVDVSNKLERPVVVTDDYDLSNVIIA